MDVATHPDILNLLRMLYGREPIPFQTLNFRFGSQQRAHADSIHFNSIPTGFMCGVWVALEDTTPENGPLFYYPGSHSYPEYNPRQIGIIPEIPDYTIYEDYIEALMETLGLTRQILFADKGDVLIWSAGLVHGGAKIIDAARTRWSQVTHYFFENCIHYTPLFSHLAAGSIHLRRPRNILTGGTVEPLFHGRKMSYFPVGHQRYRLSDGYASLAGILNSLRHFYGKVRRPGKAGSPYA